MDFNLQCCGEMSAKTLHANTDINGVPKSGIHEYIRLSVQHWRVVTKTLLLI